ncbi:MAG: hypothetical protein ACPIOQ_54085, partial [Promethearchaeia archaeon]
SSSPLSADEGIGGATAVFVLPRRRDTIRAWPSAAGGPSGYLDLRRAFVPDAPRSSSALEGSKAAEAVDIAARDAQETERTVRTANRMREWRCKSQPASLKSTSSRGGTEWGVAGTRAARRLRGCDRRRV